MLLDVEEKKVKEINLSEVKADPPWWLTPPLYFLFFLLPFFSVTIIVSQPYMIRLGQKVNNINFENVMIALLSIAMLTLGASLFSFLARKEKVTVIYEAANVEKVLFVLGGLSFVTNVFYLSPLLLHPGLLLSFLFGGSETAMFEMRQTFASIPGFTSFVTACMPFFSLYSFVTLPNSGYTVSKGNKRLFYALFVLTFMRAILSSQRLAFLIAVLAYLIPRMAFVWKRSALRSCLPFIGISGVFCLFAFGEYFRSWQYYKNFYDNYFEFVSVRFLGYFSTAVNTGSGVLTYYEPMGIPYYTANWFSRMIRIFGFDYTEKMSIVDDYLVRYATPEFNNPGGLYVPYFDYGILGGAVFFFLTGLFTGWLFYKFLRREPIGIFLFPCWFVGCLDLTRVMLWVWSGFTPIIVLSFIAAFFLRKNRRVLSVALAGAAAGEGTPAVSSSPSSPSLSEGSAQQEKGSG